MLFPIFFSDIAEANNLQLRWYTGPLADVSDDMERQLYDISAHGVSNINTAAPQGALASSPYLYVTRGFTVLQDSPFASIKSLPPGARVAVMENSTALQDININYPPNMFDLTIISQLSGKPRELLRAGDVDAIAEGYTGFWFNPEDAKDLIMINTHPLYQDRPDEEALVFWVQNNRQDLLSLINSSLKGKGNIYRYYQEKGACQTNYAFPK